MFQQWPGHSTQLCLSGVDTRIQPDLGHRGCFGAGRRMGVIFDEPKYPVIDKAPGFLKTGKCEEERIMLVSARSSLSDFRSQGVLYCSGELQHK